jgi:histidyl-tRNA synthetase
MDKVKSYLTVTGSTDEKLSKISSLLGNDLSTKATNNLKDIIDTLAFAGYSTGITFDQTIVRGLSYYTGTIYETTLDDLPGIGSFFSGGRFDNLIKQLGGPDVPAVGSAVGVDRLFEGMKQLGLVKEKKTKTKVYITNVEEGLDKDRFKLVQKLRNNGITAELTYDSPKLGNQIKAIDKLGVEKIIILGSREIENGTVVIKDLKSGDQKDVLVKNLVSELK